MEIPKKGNKMKKVLGFLFYLFLSVGVMSPSEVKADGWLSNAIDWVGSTVYGVTAKGKKG